MAVQAQYPSNLLFLDRGIGEQDRKDMDMPRQPAQAFLESSSPAMFFSNGANAHPRKRPREATTMAVGPPQPDYTNLLTLQGPSPPAMATAFVTPSPSPSRLVSTALHLAVNERRQKQATSFSPSSCSLLADDFASQLQHHKDELEFFLHDQGESLRRAVAERSRQQNRALLLSAEVIAAKRMREKQAELDRAVARQAELESRLTRLRVESAAWQAKAMAEQAKAANLQAQLRHVTAARDAEQCEDAGPAESAGSAYLDPGRVEPDRACRVCFERAASVVLFPCRHMCLCSACDGGVHMAGEMVSCPVCGLVRTGSFEAILS